MPGKESKILIVGRAWVGDMVMAHTFVRALRKVDDSQFDLLATEYCAQIGNLMPEITKVFSHDFRHGTLDLARRRVMASTLRQEGYAKAYVLSELLKDAIVPWLANIPLRYGWRGESRFGLINQMRMHRHRPKSPHFACNMAALAHPPGSEFDMLTPTLCYDKKLQAKLLDELDILRDESLVALAVGAAHHDSGKLWPLASYAALGLHLAGKGHRIALVGSASDKPLAQNVAKQMKVPGTMVLAGEITLEETACVLGACALVVSNDSGLMHLAAALGRTTIGIFGPTSPRRYSPLGKRASVVAQESPGPIEQITVKQAILAADKAIGHSNAQ